MSILYQTRYKGGTKCIIWIFLCLLQHRFQPQNPLSAAQPFSPREVGGEEEELRLSAHTLLLPTRSQLEARMMVTAFELGLDNITDDAVSTMVHAVEVCSISTQSAANLHNFACENIAVVSYFDWCCLHDGIELFMVRVVHLSTQVSRFNVIILWVCSSIIWKMSWPL